MQVNAPTQGYVPGATNYFLSQRQNIGLFKPVNVKSDWTKFYNSLGSDAGVGSKMSEQSTESVLGGQIPLGPAGRYFFGSKNMQHLVSISCRKVVEHFYQTRGNAAGQYAASLLQPAAQNLSDLTVIMRHQYLMGIRQMDASWHLVNQVAYLNSLVLGVIIPNMVEEVEMYVTYRRDATHQPLPLPTPILDTNTGRLTHGLQHGQVSSLGDYSSF